MGTVGLTSIPPLILLVSCKNWEALWLKNYIFEIYMSGEFCSQNFKLIIFVSELVGGSSHPRLVKGRDE